MRLLRAAAVLLVVLGAPGTASAGTGVWKQELPLHGARSPAGAEATRTFDLVGLHWQGSGRVHFRTRGLDGRWSSWREAAPEAEDAPDAGSAENRAGRGWRLGSPYWVGPSDRIDYRTSGDVRRLRAWYVWSPVERHPLRTTAQAGSPRIVPRSGWNANEEMRRAAPSYAKSVSLAVVHHTAGTNHYGPAASAAIVRGIELYHVLANGWNDIGYNFLVDKYGQVFEGRYGGIDRNVIGAHAQGFNTGSVGVAVIGNYSSRTISAAASRALTRLLAWRLDVAHVDPLGSVNWISGGNSKYRAGTPVRLHAVSGHRDTGFTACPGAAFYRQLPAIARQVASIGLPKLYAPSSQGSVGSPVRFTARLSSSRAWVVTVKGPSGAVVARGSGTGTDVDWTWQSAGAAAGRYTWTIEAGPETRPAQGTIGRAPKAAPAPEPAPSAPPAPKPAPEIISDLTLSPAVFSPNGDGTDDSATVSYALAGRAAVTAIVTDASDAIVATLFAAQKQGKPHQSFPWDGAGLPDGTYRLTVSAAGEDGRAGVAEASFTIDRSRPGLSLSTSTLSPNGDGEDDTLGIGYTLADPAEVSVQIEHGGAVVATVFTGAQAAGPQTVTWDGNTPAGPAAAGGYDATVTIRGPAGETRLTAAFSVAAAG